MKTCEELLKLNRQIATRKDNIEMLHRPECWNRRHLALVKPYGPDMFDFHEGVIIAEHAYSGKFVVKFVNICFLPNSFEKYEKLAGIEYASAEALYDAGWRID